MLTFIKSRISSRSQETVFESVSYRPPIIEFLQTEKSIASAMKGAIF